MADGDSSQEKTEEPTRKKLEDARKDGQTVKSKELTSFFSLISIFAYFIFMNATILQDVQLIYNMVFSQIKNSYLLPDNSLNINILLKSISAFAFKIIIVPIIIAAVISGVIAMVQVGGLIFSPKAMEIKFDKFNIVSNAKNIVSMQNLKKFIKDMVQLTCMVLVAYFLISSNIKNILHSSYYGLTVIASVFFKILAQLFLYLLLIYLFFALIDYIIEYFSFMKKMKMSIEEIKREMKNTEVSVNVKQKQRELHQEMMAEDGMDNIIKNATLVVANPTHIANVILYDPEKIKLPVVVLKAKDDAALLVRKIAKKHGILIVRDVWLARQLYSLAELKHYIPSTLVAPVADIIGKNLQALPKSVRDSFTKKVTQAPEVAPINPLKPEPPVVKPAKPPIFSGPKKPI